jgi:CheY-like chemotaxis protein
VSAHVLVIEDHPDNQKLVRYLLRAAGHRVRIATSGPDGIELAMADRPDVILIDLDMPGMDGYETVARLRQQAQFDNVPLVAVTALAMVGDREAVLRRGFDGYLPKPIEPALFAGQVAVFLQHPPGGG